MKVEQEIMEMFDKEIQKLEDIYYGEGDGFDNLRDYLKSDKNILCDTSIYPESPYELCPEKIKEFISRIITLVRNREREEMVERIDEIIAKTDDYKEKSGLYWARDIIYLNKKDD